MGAVPVLCLRTERPGCPYLVTVERERAPRCPLVTLNQTDTLDGAAKTLPGGDQRGQCRRRQVTHCTSVYLKEPENLPGASGRIGARGRNWGTKNNVSAEAGFIYFNFNDK